MVFRKLLRKVPANSVFSESKLASIHSPTYFSKMEFFHLFCIQCQKTANTKDGAGADNFSSNWSRLFFKGIRNS